MSHPRYRPPRPLPKVPEVFAVLFGAGTLGVTKEDAYALWAALSRSNWSEAIALRGVFTFHKAEDVHNREYALWLLHAQLSPRRLVRVLEELVQEKQLERATANRLKTAILARMTASGTWTTA